MPISPDVLLGIGSGLSNLASALYDPNKGMRNYFKGKLPGYASGLERGITRGDIQGIQGELTSSVMPGINAMSASMGSKLGRSAYAKGAAMSQFGKSLAPLIANLERWRLSQNQQNLNTLYSGAATGSVAR